MNSLKIKNNRRSRRSQSAAFQSERAVQLLKDIKELQILEIKGNLPPVPDVQWLRIKKDRIYSFEKSYSVGTISSSTTLDVASAITFQLSSFPEASSFQTIFDAWRISQVRVVFTPQAIGLNSTNVPPLTTVIDYDDSTALTQASLLEYDTAMTTMQGQVHIRVLNPRKAVAEYSGTAFTGYGQAPQSQWSDTNSTNTPYYGLKYVLPLAAAVQTYTVTATVLLQFRNSR